MTISVIDRRRLTAVRAAFLFDGVGSALVPDPVVVLDGATVLAVDRSIEPGEGMHVVDLPGATILPGLVDTHVHLAFDASMTPVANLAARSDDAALAAMVAAGRCALQGGVTTVRDLGDRDYLSLGLRERPDLPTIVAAGPPITSLGGHCHYLGAPTEPTEAAVRRAVRQHVERGVDVIKIMASGGNLTPGTLPERAQFTRAVLQAAVDEAHRHGLPVTAHAHGTDAIRDAVEVGVDGMEHVTFWSAAGVDDEPQLIQAIADRGIVVGATLGTIPLPLGVVPPADLLRRMPYIYGGLRRLYESGALMVAGTDAGIAPIKPHDVLRCGPAALCDIGFGAAESLRAVTSVAAKVCGLGHRKGRIAPGFDADLLVVGGDPLTDPAAIHDVQAVFARGERVR